jgi:hypothetical protein
MPVRDRKSDAGVNDRATLSEARDRFDDHSRRSNRMNVNGQAETTDRKAFVAPVVTEHPPLTKLTLLTPHPVRFGGHGLLR